MEYIEPKPVEEKPHAKRNKIIIGCSIAAVTVAAVAVGYYFLIDKIFLDYNNIDIYDYSYKYDENNNIVGTVINKLSEDETVEIPTHLRIPRKLGGYPVVELASGSCEYFQNIETVDFPDTIKVIGAEAFKDCINLTSFNAPSDLEEIGTDAFAGTKWIEEQEDGEVMIGKFLYSYKGEMENDTILVGSSTSTLIDEYPDVDIIDLSRFTHMSDGVFKDQSRIIAVEYPTTLDYVNNDTFSGCSSLEKVILPDNITKIGDNAFSNCVLTELPNISNVYSIGEGSFAFNSQLEGEITIPESVHSIGASAFRKNVKLTKVTVSNSLDTIPSSAFLDCTNLTEFVFPDSEYVASTSHIKSIGSSAFQNTKLSHFEVPYNVNTISSSAFAGCTSLTGITLYNNTTATKFISRTLNDNGVYGEWKYSDDIIQGVSLFGDSVFEGDISFKEIILVDNNGNKTASNEVHVPMTVASLGSSSISNGSKIFTRTAITKIDFSQNITDYDKYKGVSYIAPSICEDCKSLTEVIIPDDAKIKMIYSSAFKNCDSLSIINIPSTITEIYSSAFEGCTSLGTGLTFGEGITLSSYKNSVFKGTVIESVVAPNNLSDIEAGAFENCTKLVSLDLTAVTNLKTIGNNSFKGCSLLNGLVLPDSINTIGANAFEGCSSLTEIFFSVNIKSLPDSVLKDCTSLHTLTLNSSSVVNKGNGLDGCTSLTTIKVPEKLVESYKASTDWNVYTIEAI